MQLVTVQGAMLLDTPSARAFAAMDAASRSEFGVDLTITSPAGAWRSEAMVLDMYLSSPARRLAVYGVPLGGSVARPRSLGGPGSVHENGRCVDIRNWADVGSKTLNAFARRFGFINTIATEPWHFQHDGTSGGASGGGVSPIDEKEDDMPKVIVAEGHYFIQDGTTFYDIADENEATVAQRVYGPAQELALGEVRVVQAIANRNISNAPNEAEIAALAAKIREGLAAEVADAVADEQAERLRS